MHERMSFWKNIILWRSIDKIPNCDTYAQSKKCSKCFDNYELKEDGTCSKCPEGKMGTGLKCFDPIEGCGYQIDGICEMCSSGDEVLNEERNQCSQKTKIQNCSIQINNNCSVCKDGYKPSKDQKSCEICESGKDEDINSCLYIDNCRINSYVYKKYKKTMVFLFFKNFFYLKI